LYLGGEAWLPCPAKPASVDTYPVPVVVEPGGYSSMPPSPSPFPPHFPPFNPHSDDGVQKLRPITLATLYKHTINTRYTMGRAYRTGGRLRGRAKVKAKGHSQNEEQVFNHNTLCLDRE